MSAPFAQSQFTTSRNQSHRKTAAMWRGAALDHFATLEATVLANLMALDAAEMHKLKAADFVAWHRFARLASIIAAEGFSPFNQKAMRLLKAVECEHDLRTALAHGRMTASAAGITLTWHAAEKGAWNQKIKRLTWIEALEALHRLDKVQRDLGSQLGQIRRHCLPASVPTP